MTKYSNIRTNGYASKKEADYAAKFQALNRSCVIWGYEEQPSFTLIPGQGKIKGVIYRADFSFHDETGYHVIDVKGFRTREYLLKKKMMFLLKGITVEEI